MSDAKKGVHLRFEVSIKSLTYKGYEIGDIPIIWRGGFSNIYDEYARKYAHVDGGISKDIDMEKCY